MPSRSPLQSGPDRAASLRTVLVGVDGSPHGNEALAFAARLAQSTGARLVAASVYSLRPPWGRAGSGDTAAAREDADLIVIGSRHRGQLGHRLLRHPWEPARPLRHLGVLTAGDAAGALSLGGRLATATHAELSVYRGRGGPTAAGDLAEGRLDALVVPDWPHGLKGRLRRRGRPARRPAGRCALVVAPPGTS